MPPGRAEAVIPFPGRLWLSGVKNQFPCEDAMIFGAPDPAKVGQEKPKLKKGRFALRYSFRGAVRPMITGGEFSGPYAFYGTKQAQVKGGSFPADLCFYAAEEARVEAGSFTAKSAFWGAQNTLVTGGEFSGEWALCESRHSIIEGGAFLGPEALRESGKAFVSGGDFRGDGFGAVSRFMLVTGGVFSGDGFLKGSREAFMLGGSLGGGESFEQAEDLRVLYNGVIPEVKDPKSGVIAARRIDKISFSGPKPDRVVIVAEEVGHGAEHAHILSTQPLARLDPSAHDHELLPAKALAFLEELVKACPGAEWPRSLPEQ